MKIVKVDGRGAGDDDKVGDEICKKRTGNDVYPRHRVLLLANALVNHGSLDVELHPR